jgi:hypothetical protein
VRYFIDRARALAASPLAQHLKNADAVAANRAVWRSVLSGY